MADVQHIERHWFSNDTPKTKENCRGFLVITKHTTWDTTIDNWANNIYLAKEEGELFLKSWCYYRHELEYDNLEDAGGNIEIPEFIGQPSFPKIQKGK